MGRLRCCAECFWRRFFSIAKRDAVSTHPRAGLGRGAFSIYARSIVDTRRFFRVAGHGSATALLRDAFAVPSTTLLQG
ncbi:hypothetical protein WS62_17335 [Burkholderia sp. ABCPW 14]|nr:hypothetical protein WS62_17335 [Burkholderia sp. ABCPW 14]